MDGLLRQLNSILAQCLAATTNKDTHTRLTLKDMEKIKEFGPRELGLTTSVTASTIGLVCSSLSRRTDSYLEPRTLDEFIGMCSGFKEIVDEKGNFKVDDEESEFSSIDSISPISPQHPIFPQFLNTLKSILTLEDPPTLQSKFIKTLNNKL